MSTGKQKKKLKNKRRSLLKHRKCFKMEAGDEAVIKAYGQK
jgi:hypothetical protein